VKFSKKHNILRSKGFKVGWVGVCFSIVRNVKNRKHRIDKVFPSPDVSYRPIKWSSQTETISNVQ
jgi:translation elongation factor EF-4